jgi:predicted phosphodiesterase
LGKPFTVVLGNNDSPLSGLPLTLDLKRHGETFHLVHIPPRKITIESDWLLHGHTHVPRDERINGVRVFNPGSAGRANKGAPLSVGFLTKTGAAPYQAEIVLL